MSKKAIALQPILRSRLHEEVFSCFQKQIMSGTIPPGTKLPSERELANQLKVNLSTLREAFCKLEHLELIEIRHGDGVYVKDYLDSGNLELLKIAIRMDETSESMLSMMETRFEVEPIAVARAAERRTEQDLAEFKAVIENMDLSRAEREFRVHRLIARASHNLAYIIAFNFFSQLQRESSEFYFNCVDEGDNTEEYHRRLYEAIRDRKPEEAQRILREALIQGDQKYRDLLAKLSKH